MKPYSFAEDVAFLEKHGKVIVLEAPNGGRIAVSGKYQGRVMTSAVAKDSPSLGWIHRKFIEEGKTGTQFDNYGGEDRFWLGPEGGQYALYFPKGKPFDFASWQTPAAFQEGEWSVKEQTPQKVVFTRDMKLSNYAGTEFEISVERTVRLLDEKEISQRTGVAPQNVSWVAYETINTITNKGKTAWAKDKGLPSIWILAMYNPSADTNVLVPYDTAAKGDVANISYFGKVPPERISFNDKDGFLRFTCDGKYRSKIGLGPARAKESLGSYSQSAQLLTVVNYDKPKGVTEYVNSMWEQQKEPYGGDVVNSYNDGPTEPGKPSLGGFYEIETSSPAAALAPGAKITHTHRTMHFVGKQDSLSPIAKKSLGVDLGLVSKK